MSCTPNANIILHLRFSGLWTWAPHKDTWRFSVKYFLTLKENRECCSVMPQSQSLTEICLILHPDVTAVSEELSTAEPPALTAQGSPCKQSLWQAGPCTGFAAAAQFGIGLILDKINQIKMCKQPLGLEFAESKRVLSMFILATQLDKGPWGSISPHLAVVRRYKSPLTGWPLAIKWLHNKC